MVARSGPWLLAIPVITLIGLWLLRSRTPEIPVATEAPIVSDSTARIPIWTAEVARPGLSSLRVRLLPLHGESARNEFDARTLRRRYGLPEGRVWRLDWSQSDSFGHAMKALEVPWLVRQMAGIVPVQITIEVAPTECVICDPRLHIHSKNPIKDTSRTVQLDGVARPFTDVMGNESMDQFSWDPEQGMEMVRERVLDSGKAAKIQERRTVTEDLSMMVSTMTVWVEGEERAFVRRILVKVDP